MKGLAIWFVATVLLAIAANLWGGIGDFRAALIVAGFICLLFAAAIRKRSKFEEGI